MLKSTEELKAQLSLSNQHLLNFKTAEREAIFDYNKKVSAWLFYLVRFTLSNYSFDNYKDLIKEEQEFSRRKYESDVAESHLVLFMYDQAFLDIKKDLTISIIDYELILSKAIQEIYYLHSKHEIEIEYAEPQDKSAIRGSIYQKLSPMLAEYRSLTLDEYKIVHNNHIKFRELINERLKTISESV